MSDEQLNYVYDQDGQYNDLPQPVAPIDDFETRYPDWPNNGAYLAPRTSEWNANTLGGTTKIYRGTIDQISEISGWCTNYYFSYKINELPSQKFEIIITLPYDEITGTDFVANETPFFEVTTKIVPRHIFNAGIYMYDPVTGQLDRSQRYLLPPAVQITVANAVQQYESAAASSPITSYNLIPSDPKYTPLLPLAQQYFTLLISNQKTTNASLISVKRTAVFNYNPQVGINALEDFQNEYENKWQVLGLDVAWNVCQVMSSTDLISIYDVPPAIQNKLIPSYARWITKTGYGDPVDVLALGGYLVHRPDYSMITPQKIAVTQIFEFDEWLDAQYPTYDQDVVGDFPLLINSPYPAGYNPNP